MGTSHAGVCRTALPRVVQLRPRALARRAAALQGRVEERRREAGPSQDRLLEVVSGVLERADRVAVTDHDHWERLLELLEEHEGLGHALPACAVTANLVGLAMWGEPDDVADLATLTERLGHQRVARLQHRRGGALESHAGLSLTTRALRRMVAADRLREAQALLTQGVDREWTVPVLDSVDELVDIAERGTIVEWRHHMAMLLADPWSSYSRRIVEIAEQAGHDQMAAVIATIIDISREQPGETAHAPVARELRELVAHSAAHRRPATVPGLRGARSPAHELPGRLRRPSRYVWGA